MKIFLFLIFSVLLASQVFAVANGPLELDGNALSNGGEDWETLFNGLGTENSFSGVGNDPVGVSIFTTGKSKDTNDVSEWKWTNGNVPDKNELLHAYAASYFDNGQLYLYFGTDRYSVDGDATIGFWFFKDNVQLNEDGTFSGSHQDGDLLVLANYGSSEEIAIYEWDSALGEPALLFFDANAKCDTALNQDACAITNAVATNSPWSYSPKSGSANVFPAGSFLEGGILLTEFYSAENIPCFSSFLTVSRSSSSLDSQLKDFAINEFKLCGLSLDVTCFGSEIDSTKTKVLYNFGIEAENTGFGNIYNLSLALDGTSLTDIGVLPAGYVLSINKTFEGLETQPTGTVSLVGYPEINSLNDPFNESEDLPTCPLRITLTPSLVPVVNCISVSIDESTEEFVYSYNGTVTNNGFGNQTLVGGTVSSGSYSTSVSNLAGVVLTPVAPGTSTSFSGSLRTTTPLASLDFEVTGTDFRGTDGDYSTSSGTCPPPVANPSVNITKSCNTYLEQNNGKLVVKVDVDVRVCNDGDIKLTNYTVVEDFGTVDTSDDSTTNYGSLWKGACADSTYSYYPGSDDGGDLSFSDTVSVTANAILGLGQASDSDSATCGLCA